MGRVVVSEFVSLDGVFEDPGTFDMGDAAGVEFKCDEFMQAEALLLGRVTYEGFAAAWTGMINQVGMAGRLSKMPKYVVSSTWLRPTWNNSTVLRGDVTAAVSRLRGQITGDLLVAGSGTLVRALLAAGLVDELRLMVFPILRGGGRRLFDAGGQPVTLTLASSQALASGTVILTYHAEGPRKND